MTGKNEIWIAFVRAADGHVWESTARIATGPEAEFNVRQQAQNAFCHQLTADLIRKIPYGLWEAARDSGFECICVDMSDRYQLSVDEI